MRMLKLGDTGEDVKRLQQYLGIKMDGHFGNKTKMAVIKYQLHHEIEANGIVTNAVWTLLMTKGRMVDNVDLDTDLSNSFFVTPYDQIIYRYHLPKGEYVQQKLDNKYIMLHHTAGNANPYACIDMWANDKRGEIATEFVLGGQDHRSGDDKYDGVMVQAFPEGNLGWHVGSKVSGYMNRRTVGLEICSIGFLDNDMKSYVNTKAKDDQIIELSEQFRGMLYWHRYSDKQIEETEKWLKYIGERDGIDLRVGLYQWIKEQGPTKAFGFQEKASYGEVQGLLSHTNVRKDKFDVYPDPRLVDVIMSL